jgi:hypothetical protein
MGNIHIIFENDEPKKPQKQIALSKIRQIFVDNTQLYDDLVKMGCSDEEATRMVLEHGAND